MDCKCQPWNVTPAPQYRTTTGGAQFEEDDADNSGAGQSITCPPGQVLVGSICMPQANVPQSASSTNQRPSFTMVAERVDPNLPSPWTPQSAPGPHIAEEPFPWALMAAAFAGVWILTGKKR